MHKLVRLFLVLSMVGALAGIAIGAARSDTGHVLTIDDVSYDEGDGGLTVPVIVTAHVSPAPAVGERVKVDFGTSAQAAQGATAKSTAAGDSTPVFPEDFAQSDGTVTFNATETSATISVPVLRDSADEIDETFFVNLFNARGECVVPGACTTGATIGDSRGTVTLVNDDTPPVLTVDNVTQDEGDEGTTAYTFTVTKTGGSGKTVTVDYETADDTASAASDYSGSAGTLTFPPSDPILPETEPVDVSVKGDSTFESDEAFALNLVDPANATIGDGEGVGTITNDDDAPLPSMSIADAGGAEGDDHNFVVTLSSPPGPGQTALVNWATVSGEGAGVATEGTDYPTSLGALMFNAGETEQTITVPTTEDTRDESDETFTVELTRPETPGTGGYTYTLASDSATGTITDDDGAPSLTINDVTVDPEGDIGEETATFTVTLNGTSDKTVTVHWATADDTGTSAADYTSADGDLSFAPDETTKTVDVTVMSDTLDEVDETFNVDLTTPVNAAISDAQGVGTIKDDDSSMSIADAGGVEGDDHNFVVTLSSVPGPGQTAVVNWATVPGEGAGVATEGTDYTALLGSLVFTAGESEQTITVPSTEDTRDESDETFNVTLTQPEQPGTGGYTYTLADANGTATIADDDDAPSLAVSDVSVDPEGNSGEKQATFTVTMTGTSDKTVTVHYATNDDSATSADYTSTSGDLSFGADETTKQVVVTTKTDTLDEANETFNVSLSDAVNGTISDAQGVGTITDDDASTATLAVSDLSVTEGNSGTANANFAVTKTGATGLPVTVNYATADWTAKKGLDYNEVTGTLTFAPAETTKFVAVAIRGDVLDEVSETYRVNLSVPTNATISDALGAGIIVDNDAPPAISIGNDSVSESASAACTLLVKLSAKSGRQVTVNYTTVSGTAGTADYVAKSGTVKFVPGDTAEQIKIFARADTKDEPTEKFRVKLSGISPAGAASFTNSSGVCSIIDND